MKRIERESTRIDRVRLQSPSSVAVPFSDVTFHSEDAALGMSAGSKLHSLNFRTPSPNRYCRRPFNQAGQAPYKAFYRRLSSTHANASRTSVDWGRIARKSPCKHRANELRRISRTSSQASRRSAGLHQPPCLSELRATSRSGSRQPCRRPSSCRHFVEIGPAPLIPELAYVRAVDRAERS